MRRRELTANEAAILSKIQQGYGLQNSLDAVFFTDADEATVSSNQSFFSSSSLEIIPLARHSARFVRLAIITELPSDAFTKMGGPPEIPLDENTVSRDLGHRPSLGHPSTRAIVSI